MKNFVTTLFLAFVFVFLLSTNTLAEGEIPIGGRSCGNAGQPLCPGVAPVPTENPTFYKTVIDYLAQLLG